MELIFLPKQTHSSDAGNNDQLRFLPTRHRVDRQTLPCAKGSCGAWPLYSDRLPGNVTVAEGKEKEGGRQKPNAEIMSVPLTVISARS